MSEKTKKEVEKPEEFTEEKHDANAEAGSCSWAISHTCKKSIWAYPPTTGCGRTGTYTCGYQVRNS